MIATSAQRILANHEEIEVQDAPRSELRPSRAAQVLRQDRYAVENCRLCFGDLELSVRDFSALGIGVISAEPIGNTLVRRARLMVADIQIAEIDVRKTRQARSTEGDGWITGFEVVSEPIPVHRVKAANAASAMLAENDRNFKAASLPPLFVRRVYEIRNYLEDLEQRTNSLCEGVELNSRLELEQFEEGAAAVVAAHLQRAFEPLYEELAPVVDGMDPAQLKVGYEFFREQLRHLIYQAPIANRMVQKPRGYAGDFEMMKYIYRNELMGSSLFAKCIQRYYISHPNAKAVRNRAVFLREGLERVLENRDRTRETRILSVASGPAFELQLLLESGIDLENVSFGLLDQDLEALRDAQRSVTEASRVTGRPIDVAFHHKAIKNILKEGVPGPYDVIYSAGLFDYFSDAVAKAVTKRLMQGLAPGGRLIIGNFTAAARNRTLMELALDWNLIYRTEGELRRLYAGMASSIEVEAEPEGINLFVILKR